MLRHTSNTAGDAEGAKAPKPTIAEVIDKIGYGWSQVRTGIAGGGVWMADGSELLLISAVTRAVADEWQLSASMQGFVVTVVFFGLLLGNLCSGPASAYFGRRDVIVVSYVGIFFFSVVCSLAPNITWLLTWRFIVGWFIGFGQPAWLAVNTEMTPTPWRMVSGAMTQSLFSLGEIYAALLIMQDDPSLKVLHWRMLLQLGSVPALVLALLSMFMLPHSPSFLAMQGRRDEAIAVLETMRDQNGADKFSVDFSLHAPPAKTENDGFFAVFFKQLVVLSGSKLLAPTLVLMLSCFNSNLALYGCLFAFPQVLPDVLDSGAGSQLLVGALMELPGYAIGAYLGSRCFRKTASKFYFTLQACFLLTFILGAKNVHGWFLFKVAMYIGYYGIKMAPMIGFSVIYQMSTEIYPANARTTGTALCLAGGRVAAMMGPLIYEVAVELTGTWMFFFLFMAACTVLNLYVIDIVPETAGVTLQDEIDEPVTEKSYGDRVMD
eukprot:TRINITY_DN25011_c0_g1_i1.p1 TRINITY_DN25011_c0_g1~~TRINITY_DN25011_c0_g1_i1.p1  ORF type:complete len:492 (-),score=71.10 TRINITY_DN25011_c0_g1_i1:32-1507(-)